VPLRPENESAWRRGSSCIFTAPGTVNWVKTRTERGEVRQDAVSPASLAPSTRWQAKSLTTAARWPFFTTDIARARYPSQ